MTWERRKGNAGLLFIAPVARADMQFRLLVHALGLGMVLWRHRHSLRHCL